MMCHDMQVDRWIRKKLVRPGVTTSKASQESDSDQVSLCEGRHTRQQSACMCYKTCNGCSV